jgi:clan AA aspartic protease
METATMGRVHVELTVESVEDLWAARKGEIPPEKVRKVVIPDALVDTGASTLGLPTSVIKQLGLTKVKERPVRVATGTGTVSIYDVVQFTIMGRDGVVQVIEVPDGNPALIGQIPLEIACLVVDPKNQRLIGDPFTGGEQVVDLFWVATR